MQVVVPCLTDSLGGRSVTFGDIMVMKRSVGDIGNWLARSWWMMIALVAIFASAQSSLADTLPEPKGKVILTISGKLSNHNGRGEVRLDRAMIEQIGMHELDTRSYAGGKRGIWRGVLMRDLLSYVGAKGDKIEVIALDNYRMTIPRSDFVTYDVIVALEHNGKKLSVRTRGPSRIIYPYDQHEELRNLDHGMRLVWQLSRLVVK